MAESTTSPSSSSTSSLAIQEVAQSILSAARKRALNSVSAVVPRHLELNEDDRRTAFRIALAQDPTVVQAWLSASSAEVETVSLSSIKSTQVKSLFATLGFVAELEVEAPAYEEHFGIERYVWRNNEVTDFLAAANHLEEALKKAGVRINVQGGYKVVDVHGEKSLLEATFGRYKITGGTDCIIVPHGVLTNSDLGASQIRVVIDWKMPCNQRKFYDLQHVAEVFVAGACSEWPIIAVFTDLDSMFEVRYAAAPVPAAERYLVMKNISFSNVADGIIWLASYLNDGSLCLPEVLPIYPETFNPEGVIAMRALKKHKRMEDTLAEQLSIVRDLPGLPRERFFHALDKLAAV